MMWMNLENLKLSEISQTEKVTYCMIYLYEMCRKGRNRIQIDSCQGLRRVKQAATA